RGGCTDRARGTCTRSLRSRTPTAWPGSSCGASRNRSDRRDVSSPLVEPSRCNHSNEDVRNAVTRQAGDLRGARLRQLIHRKDRVLVIPEGASLTNAVADLIGG